MNDQSSDDLEVSLGNALDSAYESAEGNISDDKSQLAQSNETITPTVADETSSVRDENGRFKKAQPNDAQQTPKAEGKEQEQTTQPEGAAQVQAIKPPSTFTIEGKAEFLKASPALQKEILRREEDIIRGIEQYKHIAEYGQRVQQAIQPYMATINSLGVHPEQAVQHLLGLDHRLRYGSPQEKITCLGEIAQNFGVDLGQLSAEQPQVDPTIRGLQNQVQQLQQYLNQQHSKVQTTEQQYVQNEIEQFRSNPENVYFDDVRLEIGALMSSGRANDLKDAYEKACWANPQIRDILLKQQNEQSEKKRLAEIAQKAETAKRASFDVQGTGSVASNAGKELTLEEELAAQFG